MARHWVSSALILRDHVVWFGWTATPDAIAEQLVLKNGGFRSIGTNNYLTIHSKDGSANEVVGEKAPTIASVDGAEEGRRGVEKAGGFSRRSSGTSESMLVSEKIGDV
jgi:hypothetical protein